MPKCKVNRFLQDPGHCSIAACATLVNFYNPSIDYNDVKEICGGDAGENSFEGLDSGEIGILLNKVGFFKDKAVLIAGKIKERKG
jgi:hypothetical protein